jgi:hypothetical protein
MYARLKKQMAYKTLWRASVLDLIKVI